jgi:hypothetical protein
MGVDAVNLEDIFRQIHPSMQLTANRSLRREGGVHTIGAVHPFIAD